MKTHNETWTVYHATSGIGRISTSKTSLAIWAAKHLALIRIWP
jgi:hypothetical protein